MTSVEKRRSSRKSGVYRKHSDGGYSDTSSGGSFLDETDREVSNLTDRAFRSLCIGDEAVYNDSDLCSSSPCTQRDRQLAFSQSGQDRDKEDREELKRAAHESFSLRVQQFGQDWIHGGLYGSEIHRDPQWEVYGQKTQGRVSATFQHSFMEASQQEKSLREEHLSFISNGATKLSLQQRRSQSRVSSLIRAFNSEGQSDRTGMDGKLKEWNDEASWDKSALMSIKRELSEFSYQQNFNHFPSSGPFSSRDTNFYSSEAAAVTHVNSESSFMRSSHSKHSMSAQVNCTSNFFIHSEFSPFKVWREHNRFPFKQEEVSGFMHCSEFPKWYETPMYKELSLGTHPQGPYRFNERGVRHQRYNLAPVVHPTLPRSTSTSTMVQKTSALEKRCESELTSHYPHRKRTQSLGTNRFPSQRPSTASPTTEMYQSARDTLSSAEALRQKVRMMTEQNMATANQGVICSNDNLIPFSNTSVAVSPNVVNSKSSTNPSNISSLLTTVVNAHQEAETSEVPQYVVSPQPVEHPPVRAESRGATPDVRMSSYKSRATSLLFNLKDNRKRVKSTYSPTKFKGLDALEKNKQPSVQEPRDTVIDIPDFPDSDIHFPQAEECSRTNPASHQYINEYRAAQNSQPATADTGQNKENMLNDYQAAQIQGEVVHHSGLTGFIHENYTSTQLVNGQNLQKNYKQDMIDHVESVDSITTEMQRLNANNNPVREYLISEANTKLHFNENVGKEFTKVDQYEQCKDNKHDYSNVSSLDRWRQTKSQDPETVSLKAVISPWKQEITALTEKDQHAQTSQRPAVMKKELNLSRDKNRVENQQSINKELKKTELRESFGAASSHKRTELVNPNISNQFPQYAPFSNNTAENQANYGQQQPGEFRDKYIPQTYYGHNRENEVHENNLLQSYNRYTEQEPRNQHNLYSYKDKTVVMQETSQRKQNTQIQKGHEQQSIKSIEAKPQFQYNVQKNSLSHADNASIPTMVNPVKDRQFIEVKAEQATAEHTAQHFQAELAKAQPWTQVEQPKVESAKLNIAGYTSSEKVKAEEAKNENIKVEKTTGEQTENLGEKQLQQARVKRITEEPRMIMEEAKVMHMKEEENEQVKAEQTKVERRKQHMNTLANRETGQATTQQVEQTIRGRIKAEQAEEEQTRAEQVEREGRDAEQIKTGKVKAEQIEAEGKKAEEAKHKQINELQAGAEQEKTNVVEVGKVRANHTKAEAVRQEKNKEDSIKAGQINTERSTTLTSKPKEAKVEKREEQAKLKQTKVELANAELTNRKMLMQENSFKPLAKLTMPQQSKIGPDRVEQVKTELAKAKAELAKIKEKMRGEQKQQAKNTVIIKEDNLTNRVVASGLNINKKEDHNIRDYATVNRNSRDQADRGIDDYERLREKYGFTNAVSTNKKVSTVENLFSHNAQETPVFSLDKAETTNIEKSKHEDNPTANIEKKGIAESYYVYSESSKEFKLTSANYLPAAADNRANTDTATDKMKDPNANPVKQPDVSQQRDVTKPLSFDRKSKSAENSTGPAKDPHLTPPRVLSHKERVQTKQEILTSKIKAHAEKEISAILEKGFAGFISKNSPKQLAGSHFIRQRPASQEVSKKHGSMSSNITPMHQMEPSGIQMVPVKSVSPFSSATIPVTSTSSASQLTDHSERQDPKEPEENNGNVLEPHIETIKKGSCAMSKDEGLLENQRKGKHDANHEGNYEKEECLKDNPVINANYHNKKTEDSLPAATLDQTESSSPPTVEETAESKHEAVDEDSGPSLNLIFGHDKDPVVDDSLQIMGIRVIVRERKPFESNIHGDNITHEQMNLKGQECSYSDLNKSHPSSSPEACKEKTSLMEVSISKTKDTVVQENHPTVKTDQTNVAMNNHSENVQETSTVEMRQNIVSEDITEKSICTQPDSSFVNSRPLREGQLHEPLVEKGLAQGTVPAKNKRLADTQPLLYKEDIVARGILMPQEKSAKNQKNNEIMINTEEKNPQKRKTPDTTENFMAKMVNKAIDYKDDTDAQSVTKHDVQLSMNEDKVDVIKPPRSKNIDGKSAPLLEEKMHDSAPAKQLNKLSPSNHLTQNENIHTSSKLQYIEKINAENNKVADDVHIDSIAIRVVPAVTGKEHLKKTEKDLSTSDVVNEHKQVATASSKENVNTSNNEDRAKDLKHMQDNLEYKFGVQYVLSSVKKLSDSLKTSNQQNCTNASSVNCQTEDGKPEKVNKTGKSVDESKLLTMEGDYFQVQGLKGTNNIINVEDISDGATKAKEFPGLLRNEAAISSESYKTEKSQVLDQSKPVELSVENKNVKSNNLEKGDKWDPKQFGGSTEEQSNNEKFRKHHREQSLLATRERQRSKYSQQAIENTAKGKPEGKPTERISAIPEISAIADYARLKVIVSEDRANTLQEFPPNKKEGFFPLIQTRHSRRPLSTADSKDLSVKEKSFPNKTEVSTNVNKEPKALVFPITEKEHQRTGMFKLGDKERHDKSLLDVKSSEYYPEHLTEKNKSLTALTEQVAGSGTQRVSQIDQSRNQPNDHPLQTTLSSAVNRPINSHEGLTYLDKKSHPQPTLGQMHNIEESMTIERKDGRTEKLTGDGKIDKLKQVNLANLQDKAKQPSKAKCEEKLDSRIQEQKRAENTRTAYLAEEERIAQREENRTAQTRDALSIKIKERQEKLREAERKAEDERKQAEKEKPAHKGDELREMHRQEERRMKEDEEKMRKKAVEETRAELKGQEQIKENEDRKSLKQQEEGRAAQEEHQMGALQVKQQRRTAQEQQKTRATQEEHQITLITQEEQQRRGALEKQQRRTSLEEQQWRASKEEEQRKAAQEEQQRKAAQEEQQRKAAQEKQQRRAAQEEQQRKAAQEEQQRKAAQEEQQRKAAQEKQQRIAAQEEQQRKAAQEEQQRKAAQEEQQRKAAQEEQQRRAAREQQQRRAAQEEQQRKAAQEEQQRRAAQKEQQRKAAQEEQQRRAAQEEQQRKAAQEEQQRRATLIEEQRRAKQTEAKILLDFEERKRKQIEVEAEQISDGERVKQMQKRAESQIKEEWMRTQREEQERKTEKEKTVTQQRDQKQTKGESSLFHESHIAIKEEEKRVTHEQQLAQREDETRVKKREEHRLEAHRETDAGPKMEEQKRAAQRMDALQYYAITSTESERKSRGQQQINNSSGLEIAEDSGSHSRPYRPPASPAPSLPRSNTSSPALGAKPSMFRVKDNTIRGSSFTKSVKPRFHKNFGEDFHVSSHMERGLESGEEEQEIRRTAVTPVLSDTGFNRLATIKESSTFQAISSSQNYAAHLSQHKPYSRRSIALDEDDSRSVISNISEDVESFATSAADLADIRGLYDYERPESACSFSSDVSRSMSKPPVVPPKSEKALQRAKRLTSRRIKKELSKAAVDRRNGVEKSPQEVSNSASSSSTEVHSSDHHAVASPHFSPPVSLAHAPTLGSNFLSSDTEHQSSHHFAHASPHATGPISLPAALPHTTAPISLATASPHATGSASHTAAPKTVAHVPSFPTLHHANHPAPVTQYHLESSYSQSYPLTQRKVLQDLGSGQYYVVDVPVQVKTKTFFDPETGKYVQLNVRESGQSTSLPQPQQTYPQSHFQPKMQVKSQQQPLPQALPVGKPLELYQGYHGYPQGYKPINSVPPHGSSVTLHQDQHPVRENKSYGYPVPETGQNSESHHYSPEKTPYMDTVNDTEKTYSSLVYNTHGSYESFPECDTNSQLAGSSACENDNSAHSQYQPRDIITMSELEDFMDVSEW